SAIFLTLIYKKLNESEKNIVKISGTIIAIFFLGTAIFSHDIWPHYLVGLPVFYILLLSIALNRLNKESKSLLFSAGIVAVFFIANWNPLVFIVNLKKPLFEGDASVYRNQIAVIDYIYREASGKKFKYVVYTPPVHDY